MFDNLKLQNILRFLFKWEEKQKLQSKIGTCLQKRKHMI